MNRKQLIMGSARWTLGTVVGLPVAGVLVLAFLVVSVLLFRRWRTETFEPEIFLGLAATALGVAVAVAVGGVFAYYPFQAEYHQWRPVSGTVTDISSRLVGADKSTTQRFVVTLDGVGQRSCDDTRCATVKVGDVLDLTCKRAWQYSGTDGYDCNFVGIRGRS